jgi:hypothetical protein
MSRQTTLKVNGRTITNEVVGEMTRALRRSAEYSLWSAPIGKRIRLPDIEDVGEYLKDERWVGWAARLDVKRLSDAPKTGYHRYRIDVLVAMPGWFANLRATYVDVMPRAAAATHKRRTVADAKAAKVERLRVDEGLTIEEAAEKVDCAPTTIVRYRKRLRGQAVSSEADETR